MTIMHSACESPVDRAKRLAKVEAGVRTAFRAAIHHMGEADARALFARVLRRPKRGRGKALAGDRDGRLLRAYDDAPEGESIAAIARRLRAESTQLGNTAAAIAAQIRKLVSERKKRDYRARVDARRWRMAMRNEPPTLASGAISRPVSREK
ncbi:MAG: hypothetical protein WB764_22805 [Xanthobacteraceae bacterium]